MRGLRIALLAVATLTACGNQGTYVVLHFENGPQDVNVITAMLTLGSDTKPVTYNAGAGAMFPFPRTATIEIGSESGALSVVAQALDSNNTVLATAMATGTITRNQTLDLHFDFGTGTPPDLSMPPNGTLVIMPMAFDFGAANVGGMGAVKRFTVTNTGTVASGPIAITKAGDMNDFMVASPADCATKSLDPNAMCTVDVQFAPMTPLIKAGKLVVTAAGPGGTVTADLAGKGVAKGNLAFNEDAHTFPDTLLMMTSADVTFTLTNSGLTASAPVTVSLTGTDADQFAIASGDCSGMSVTGKGTCTVVVHAKPSARGTAQATLEADAGNDTALVTLTSKGLAPAHLTLTTVYSAASPFDLGQVEVGSTGDGNGLSHVYTFTLKNDGDTAAGTLVLTSVPSMNNEITALAGTTCIDVNTGMTPTLNPGDTCTASLVLQPVTFGKKTIAITASAMPGGMVTTNMIGVGHDQVVVQVNNNTTSGGTGTIFDTANGINCDQNNGGTCMKTFDRVDQNSSPTINLDIKNLGPNTVLGNWTTNPNSLPCNGMSMRPCTVTFDSNLAAGTYQLTANYAQTRYAVNVTRSDANYTNVGSLGNLTFSTGSFSTCGNQCQTNATLSPNTMLVITASSVAPGTFAGSATDVALRGITLRTTNGHVPVVCQEGAQRTAIDANPLTCTINVNADLDVNVTYSAHNYAFVSSQTYDGNLGGLSGADGKCQALANAVSLPGTFKAVVSDSTHDVAARVPKHDGWVRVDGKPFASGHDELFGSSPANQFRMYFPILFDETGAAHNNLTDKYRTSSSEQGIGNSVSCADWTSNANVGATVVYGVAGAVSGSWIDYAAEGSNCTTKYGLVCLGTDNTEPVPPPPTQPAGSRFVFVSSAKAAGGFSITSRSGATFSMDLACQTEGQAAFGAGKSFRSLVATAGFSASAQVGVTGTWVRPDFIPVGDQNAFINNNGPMQTGINQLADGTYVGPTTAIWTGATTPTATPANANDDCTDWTSQSGGGGSTGRATVAGVATPGYFDTNTRSCGNGAQFYCIQYGP